MPKANTKKLLKYVVPTMLSNISFFLFTIVDGIFVGHGVGTNALGAINLLMPCLMGIYAIFMLTTIGGVTVISIRLGRGDVAGANRAFMHAVSATLVVAAIFSLLGVSCTDTISSLLGANETFHHMTCDYLFWFSFFLVPASLTVVLEGMCRSDAAPSLVTAAVVTSTSLNILGDWFFIFQVGMGVEGSAIATGISETVALFVVLPHFLRKKGDLSFRRFLPSAALYRQIVTTGLPESVAQLAAPVTVLCMNYMLIAQIGDIGVNAFSIITYVSSFAMAIFFGCSEGVQPLLGRSYGAKNEVDLKYYFHRGLAINIVGSLAINVFMLTLGSSICRMFGVDAATLSYTADCMPQFTWGFLLMAPNLMITAYLYSTKRAKQATIISVLRGLVVNSLVIFSLPIIFGSGAIWFSMGVYEAIVLVVSLTLLKHTERNGVVFR